MSGLSVPLVGIDDAEKADLPLLGPKKNALSGSPMEYCLEVENFDEVLLWKCFLLKFSSPTPVFQIVDDGITEAGIWECTPGSKFLN
jgi:hypothetical protein